MNKTLSQIKIPVSAWPYGAALLLVLLGALVSPGFADPDHLLQILNLASFLGIVAVGQTFVILSGGIDLSVSSTVTMAGVVSATLMNGTNANSLEAVLVCLAIGLAIGVVNGLGVAFVNIHPMVMTLGTMTAVQGVALLYTNGSPKGSSSPFMSELATGRLFGAVPYVLLVWAVLAVIAILLLHRTVWGRWLYALGNSMRAATFSGVDVKWMLVSLYAVSGVLAAVTGVLLTGYTRTSYLTIGDPYQLNSIASVVIGGASIMGGSGSYAGTVAGAIIMVLLQSLLPIISIPEAGRRIISGLLILCLLLIYGRERKRR